MILEQNKQKENKKESASPLKTEEIISILNKTNNEKFSRENKITSNISSNFKGFSLKQIPLYEPPQLVELRPQLKL